MAAISIGVPVYNEADFLKGSLENLANQTFKDFEVLIFDNASDDATGEVAKAFAEKDFRFQYFRQPENLGPLKNFYDCLLAARSPYFLWRAADDRSDNTFLEVLHETLEAEPEKLMSVGTVISNDMDGSNKRITRVPDFSSNKSWIARRRALNASHASWIYGMFRRQPLTDRMKVVFQNYAYPWAFDHLVLFPFIIDGKVTGSNKTEFNQVIKRVHANRRAVRKSNKADTELMRGLRHKFLEQIRADVAEREPSELVRAVIDPMLWLYTGKRVYKYRKLARRKLFD